MIAGGQRQDLIEVFAVDPELEFAGRVAGIFAGLEHGDNNNFYLDGFCRGRGLRVKRERGQKEQEADSAEDKIS